MSPDDARAALYPLGLVGLLGMFLPGYDKSWNGSPDDPDMRERVRVGEGSYLVLATSIGLLASRAASSRWPLLVAVGWAGAVVAMHELALRHRPRSSL